MGRFPSGQREQTVNLPRKLRWFESTPAHHLAGMAELADALDSGSSDHYDSCRFKSCFPHQNPNVKTFGFLYCSFSIPNIRPFVTRLMFGILDVCSAKKTPGDMKETRGSHERLKNSS